MRLHPLLARDRRRDIIEPLLGYIVVLTYLVAIATIVDMF